MNEINTRLATAFESEFPELDFKTEATYCCASAFVVLEIAGRTVEFGICAFAHSDSDIDGGADSPLPDDVSFEYELYDAASMHTKQLYSDSPEPILKVLRRWADDLIEAANPLRTS